MRNTECRKHWNELVDLAEGREMPEAAAHASSCESCGQRLQDLRNMIRLTGVAVHNAPTASISRAQAIFAPRRPVVLARLSAVGAGARAVAESVQIRWEADGLSVRLMIRPEGSGWQVLGQISGTSATEILYGDDEIPITNGAFEFKASSLDEDLWVDEGERLVRIPLRSEA